MSNEQIQAFVDTSWLVYRSHHAYSDLCTVRDGQPVETGVLYGAVVCVATLRRRFPGCRIYFALDDKRENLIKRKRYPWYKDREGSSTGAWDRKDELFSLIASVPDTVLLKADGYEADDVIASGVRQVPGPKVIFGSDKDLLQLTDVPDTRMVTNISEKSFTVVDAAMVQLEWGVPPGKMLMLRSILGDPGDKIPRLIPRLREKVAVEIALAYQDPPQAWEQREDLKRWSKIELAEELYGRWLAHYELTALQVVPVVQVLPPTQTAEYWRLEWGMRSAAEVMA